MKKNVQSVLIFSVILIAANFASCKTLSDISINTHKDQLDENLIKIETAVVPLEAVSLTGTAPNPADIASARSLIANLEKESAADRLRGGADADYSGKLLAWSGRLALLEGRYSEAQRLHRQSASASLGNIPSLILGIRLEGDPAKRLEAAERELILAGVHAAGAGEFNIEKARALIDLNRFSEAAGAFDAAFNLNMNPVYRESYAPYRTRAYELRNAAGVGENAFRFIIQEMLSWGDCINIIKNETQLLRFLTGGRNVADTELFNSLLNRAFIPFTQDITVTNWPIENPDIKETVTRAGAAYLIWRLFAESRADLGMIYRYSARYAAGDNPRSPISDVPVLSPFFDSILGCVEREILSLPDGRTFKPALPIRGTEFLAMLRKIE